MSATQTSEIPAVFNLVAKAVGYINRIRIVTPKKGTPYLACSFTALHGEDNRTYVELNVAGNVAKHLIKQLINIRKDEPTCKIFASIDFSDFQPDSYLNKKGETVLILRGRLLKFGSIKIDGEEWYKLETPVAIPATHLPAANDALSAKTA